jgi:hypothetical protein
LKNQKFIIKLKKRKFKKPNKESLHRADKFSEKGLTSVRKRKAGHGDKRRLMPWEAFREWNTTRILTTINKGPY